MRCVYFKRGHDRSRPYARHRNLLALVLMVYPAVGLIVPAVKDNLRHYGNLDFWRFQLSHWDGNQACLFRDVSAIPEIE